MSIPRQGPTSNGDRVRSEQPGRGAGAKLPFVVALDDSDTPYDVVDALALGPFTSGDQPWARSVRIDRLRPGASLLPVDAEVVRTVVEDSRDSRLATGDGWTVRAVRWRGGSAEVLVTAVSEELARTVLDGVVRQAAAESATEGTVTMGFWYLSAQRGPTRITRRAATTAWPSIRRNYPSASLESLDRLMGMRPEALVGRLILLHGPAGTGKTTILRAMAHEWRRWCQVDCVLDPEALFGDPGYLMEVAIGSDDGDDDDPTDGDEDSLALTSAPGPGETRPETTVAAPGGTAAPEAPEAAASTVSPEPSLSPTPEAATAPPAPELPAAPASSGAPEAPPAPDAPAAEERPRRRWRLLVVEDCDELLRGDARSVSGQALSRLLNLTDGLVGQGREVLVALTTNEPLARLHPAIVRPGRCLAQVEVGALPRDEAVAWLGSGTGVASSMTLAELFALRDGRLPTAAQEKEGHTGLYL